MQYDDFLGNVQHRLELPDTPHTVKATRIVLTTLGERLQPGEAEDLAGPLPLEIDRFLLEAESGQRFDYDEFVERIAERGGEGVDGAEAAYWAQEIVALLTEVVPPNEMRQVREQLPADYEPLFDLVEEGENA